MSNYKQMRRGYDIDTAAPAAQKITIDDKWKGHSVTLGSKPRTMKLAGDGDKVEGSIAYFDSGQVVIVIQSEDVPFKNAGTTAIALGSRIVGATRTVDSTTVYGYVKPFTSAATADAADTTEAAIEAAIKAAVDTAVDAALKARGSVIDGGATSTAGADVPADVRVAFSSCE